MEYRYRLTYLLTDDPTNFGRSFGSRKHPEPDREEKEPIPMPRYRVDAEPHRNHAVAPPRITSTGSPEWRTTFSVTLPSTQRFTPDLPCVHIVISALGVLRA
jgi:hypothetical protein